MTEEKKEELTEKVEELSESKSKTEEPKVKPENTVAEEIARLNAESDLLEEARARHSAIKALGGKSIHQAEKTQEDKDKEEAAEILKPFGF